jgi:lipoprotein-anchoring transpeptidase ErfK/SrfK
LVRRRRGTSSPASIAAALLPLAAVILVSGCGGGGGGGGLPAETAATPPSVETRAAAFPQAGMILRETIVVRAAPSRSARSIEVLRQFRPDNRPTIVFAVGSVRDRSGESWYRIHVPGRTNALKGWIAATTVKLQTVRTRIVVDRSARTLKLYDQARLRFQTKVAVGRPGTETPTGSFYVRAGFRATEPWLGAYALETSAYSNLSEWPGGGIIGIHGTPQPELLGTAASHGCVRVSNAAALTLARLVPMGAAISIVD